jgi:hypothetical protein
LTRQGYIGLPQLREQAFVLPAHGYDLRDLTITTCENAGFTPRTGVDGGATDAVASLVEAGLGIALLPAMIAAGRPGLRATPLAPPGASRTIALAARREAPLTKAAAAFAAALEAHLTDLHAWGRLPEGMQALLFLDHLEVPRSLKVSRSNMAAICRADGVPASGSAPASRRTPTTSS